MISVRPLHGPAAAEYYLQRDAGCEADYYLDRAEPAGRWCGRGAAALALAGPLGELDEVPVRRLLAGQHPFSGEQLARPVWRPDPAGRLLGRPLVAAVHTAASERGTSVGFLLGDERVAAAFAGVAAVADRRPAGRSLDPRVAQRVAAAAGLDPVEVFRDADGTDTLSPALAAAGSRQDARVAGYDVCVSAPKSVSTLFALTDPAMAGQVRAAHDTAVAAAVGYLEREAGHGLRGHQGDGQRAVRVGTDGLVAAAFGHRTSRANDPQLHTHVVVANLLHGEDGKWTALDSRALHRHATAASYLYHATLRAELTRDLGVTWTRVDRGIAEIVGVPQRLLAAFSTRRADIEARLAVLGRDDPAAAENACLATRPRKQHVAETDLRSRWRDTAVGLGVDPATLVAEVTGRVDRPPRVDVAAALQHLAGPKGLTAKRSTVEPRDMLMAFCEALPPGAPLSLAMFDEWVEIVSSRDVLQHLIGDDTDVPRYTTTELLATERHALELAEQLRGTSNGTATAAPHGRGLTVEQAQVAETLTVDTAGLAVVVGPAGSGKTAALAAAHHAWNAAGIPVYGTAVAALAARGLQTATGIRSVTLTRLLADLDRPDPTTGRSAGLAPGAVLVVDEAGMVDTRTLTRLLDHTAASQARLILVGDPEQLPEIEAGGLFAALARHPTTLELSGNVRQDEAWEVDALTALRSGRVGEAVAAYLDHGRIITADHPLRLQIGIARDYRELSTGAQPQRVVALAGTRLQARLLNSAIRDELHTHGHLDGPGMYVDVGISTAEFVVGDVVVATRNHHAIGLLNGTRGVVTSIDPAARTLTMRGDDGHEYPVEHRLLATGDVIHGYALTVHRAQGITVDVALALGTSALTKESGYVALSRGRVSNRLYATVDELTDTAGRIRSPSVRDRMYGAINNVQNQLQRQARQSLARDQHPYPRPSHRHLSHSSAPSRSRGIER